jgi:small subunit ribosomal protein S8
LLIAGFDFRILIFAFHFFELTDGRSPGCTGKETTVIFYIMNTDPIADYLTRVRNAIKANHRVVEIPASNLKKEITKVLFDKGYIANYKFEDNGPQGSIKVALKYHPVTKIPAIRTIERISKPGLRKYTGTDTMPRVLNGLGIAILSTSKGVMTDKEARQQNVGGEVLCYVY